MEKVSRKAPWKQRGMQHNGNASWKAILVERHGKSVMESITETARRAASRKGVMQTDSCEASPNSCHGMRNGKHQRSQNVALSECHGKVIMDGFMEYNTYGTSWKGVTEINICLASWKRCHGKRHGNSEVHSVMECVVESMSQAASRKRCHGKRHG